MRFALSYYLCYPTLLHEKEIKAIDDIHVLKVKKKFYWVKSIYDHIKWYVYVIE